MSSLDTKCVHAGEYHNKSGAVHTPLFNCTTFEFENTAALLDVVEGRAAGNLYTRYGLNPTITALEAKLAAIENGEMALAFCSGMAAEAALFLAHGRKGVVVIGDAYGGTLELVEQQLPLLGITTHLLLGSDVKNGGNKLEEILAKGVGLIFLETPTNPTLEVLDIRDIAALAHKYNALLCVDNTFASPVNQQPLSLGADFVVHSATKYLGGHSDVTAGVVIGSKQLVSQIWGWRKNLGQTIAPESAILLLRSLRTLTIRVRHQSSSAYEVALALSKFPQVKRVLYPGLESNNGDHEVAKKQMSGFGGILSAEFNFTYEETIKFVDKLKLFKIAPSLGGVESLVTQPVTTTHHGLDKTERERRGISDSMVRFSIGLENVEDLLEDITKALQ